MAMAGRSDDAPTTGAHHHGASVRLHSYGLSTATPELTDHLLLDDGKPRAHCLEELPSFWRPKPSGGDPASAAARRHVVVVVDWASVRGTCKEWIVNPMNIALLLWLLCVGVSGGMFVLLLLGLLDGAFPAAADRNRWIEINNQVLNALFTLMSLYQHPALCHHLFLLCRWRPTDAAELRATYCKDGPAAAAAAPRSGDRAHVAVVVALLHLTVVCQYLLCGLYWGYTRTTRPELAEDGFFVLGIVAPVAAAVYTVCSPLGKGDRCHELASSVATSAAAAAATKSTTQPIGHVVVEPEWAGGMLDCGGGGGEAAAATACLSLSCTFCVFGWNMERLGLGNACVHAVTFALLCFAPLWVLGVSALHIHNVVIGDAVGGAGVLLCAGGLLYGGYWRIQMRTRFGLPGTTACCGSMSLTDYARWLFCWPCALAQEVRTASMYHVDGEVFYSKVVDEDGDHADSGQALLTVSKHHDVFSAADTVSVSQASPANDCVVVVHDETTMAPPVQVVVVQVEDECSVARHGETSGSSVSSSATASEEDDVSLLEAKSNREMLEDADRTMLSSDGSWRVEKVKRLINMVTLVSLLILLYTRGIIL